MIEKYFPKDKAYIIAEIGGNFTDLNQAKRLIDLAIVSKVNAVKIQTFQAGNLASKHAYFDMENTGKISQYKIFKKYELDHKLQKDIFAYAKKKNIECFSTPSHENDLDFLEKINVRIHKIGSDDLTNLPFLKKVAATKKIIILSTGMSFIEEVKEAVNVIMSEGNKNIALLHCTSCYPTHPEDANLNVIKSMIKIFPGIPIGYSDHTMDTTAAITAFCFGARIVEKHFTYDRNADGPDHMLSANEKDMANIVSTIRKIEILQGSYEKKPTDCEKKNRLNNRKSIVLKKNLSKGTILTKNDLTIKRPGNGISPKFLDKLIDKKLKKDLEKDHIVKWDEIE